MIKRKKKKLGILFLLQNRPSGGVTGQKVPFAQDHGPIDSLEEVVRQIKPTAIIGRLVYFTIIMSSGSDFFCSYVKFTQATCIHLQFSNV